MVLSLSRLTCMKINEIQAIVFASIVLILLIRTLLHSEKIWIKEQAHEVTVILYKNIRDINLRSFSDCTDVLEDILKEII